MPNPDQRNINDGSLTIDQYIAGRLAMEPLEPPPGRNRDQEAIYWQASRIAALEAAALNRSGDDLCWLTEATGAGEVKIPPAAEFLESCRRFHAQIAGTAGVLGPECMTIAQLEARVTEQARRIVELEKALGNIIDILEEACIKDAQS